MQQLAPGAFARAREFIKTAARPLDRALFEHHFEGAPAGVVIAELARYQNEDGGFGHALEPDVRTPASSALCTGIALELLRDLHAPADHVPARGGVGYLLATFDPETGVWPVLPPAAQDAPRAPWWHDEDGSLARTFDGYRIIPRAQIVAALYAFSDAVSATWLAEVAERTVAAIENTEPLGVGGGDDLVYALGLAASPDVPLRLRDRLLPRLRAAASRAVSRDPAEWAGYAIAPLKLAPRPDSPAADLIAGALQEHLDYTIAHQSPSGAWEPTWSWSDRYPEVWRATVLHEWRGHLTLTTLLSLRAFGRA